MKKRSPFELLFIGLIVTANVYNFYRYAFQINSSITSPIYRDTPLAFQAGKYVLFGLYLVLTGVLLLMQKKVGYRISGRHSGVFLGCLLALTLVAVCLSAFAFAFDPRIDQIKAVVLFFFIPALFTMPLFLDNYRAALRVQWWLVFFGFGYHALYEALQLVLYYATDRLPALGYHDSLVRFGAGWDDPNGCAAYFTLLILVFLAHSWRSRWLKISALAICLVVVFYTKSLSGFLGLAAAFTLYFCFRLRPVIPVVVGALVLAVVLLTPVRDIAYQTWLLKRESAEMRINQNTFSYFTEYGSLASIFVGESRHDWATETTRPNENSYLELIISYGVPFAIGFVLLLGWTIVTGIAKTAACRRLGLPQAERYFAAWTAFVTGIAFSANFVPFFIVFPVSFFFWTVVMLIWLTPLPASP